MWKKVSAVGIPTVISVALIWYMLYRVWDDIVSTAEHIVPLWLIASISVCLCAWLLRGFRYQEILKRLNTKAGVLFSTACICVSQTANIILPARLGDFVRMFILKHEKGTTYTNSFTSLIAERVYDVLIVAFLGLCSLPFLISLIPNEYFWFVWLIVGVLFCGILGICVLTLSKNIHAENRIIKKILEIFTQFRTVSSNLSSLCLLSATSIVIWLLDVLICYIVALMFGIELPFILVLLAIVIGNLVKAIPITPGGIGTYELALVVVFQIGGVPVATATLVAVVDHLIKNGMTLAGGIISLYYFGGWLVSLLKYLFKGGKVSIQESH